MRINSCVLLHAVDRRTQLFILIFIFLELDVYGLADPVVWVEHCFNCTVVSSEVWVKLCGWVSVSDRSYLSHPCPYPYLSSNHCTGIGKKAGAELFAKLQPGRARKRINATYPPPFSRALYLMSEVNYVLTQYTSLVLFSSLQFF